ncbi:protein phosphatase 2C domain-containing protein [Actinokineospora sp. NBRC 105648]|uniref:PP2C family protein-serine/threonine phosphatase n=1 Tax=Actinokineospora sp. NBRC 105648 TaxID=3032206 RepID=UPI0024A4CD05|nr:protein phosphatase 2C domain-containing protein [Actinokineospora sp. NBRC 105648]GLZ40523.1 hypothetical protein Acsp05_41470 [Actinokineospora sp. NBRC 105648]
MKFSAANVSALGGRTTNQDASHAGGRLLVVADGVGGAPAGEVASALAVQAVVEHGGEAPGTAASLANAAVRAHGREHPATAGMGSTLDVAAMVRREGRWLVRGAHVGDSVVLVVATDIHPLTRAHTLADELVAAGHLTPEEGARHPQRSALMRAIGMEDQVRPDLWERSAIPGERYLLCSDGLPNALGKGLHDLLFSLRKATAAECANELVRAAVEAGARDNVTAVVGDVAGGAGWRS